VRDSWQEGIFGHIFRKFGKKISFGDAELNKNL